MRRVKVKGLAMPWPRIEPITTPKVQLDPLAVDHAADMVAVLAHPSLYEHIGGAPPNVEELKRLYKVQSAGQSQDGAQWWLNWVVRRPRSQRLAGYVQATVEHRPKALEADLAWVIAPPFQRRGLASAATAAMTQWLQSRGVESFTAHIHPLNVASKAVARKVGLHVTDVVEDGENRWESGFPTAASR